MADKNPVVPGTVAGVLALAAFVGFAVGLPELTESDSDAAAEEADSKPVAELLPAALTGGLVTIAEMSPESSEMAEGQDSFGASHLEEVFDADAAVRRYATPDQQDIAVLTIIDIEPGLFQPAGPPVDPELLGAPVAQNELQKIGDAQCWINWGSPEVYAQTEGQPLNVDCQQGADGRTFDLYAIGMTAEEVAQALDDVVADATAD